MLSDIEYVVAGGGSGGHTSAAVGIIEVLADHGIGRDKILWIGSYNGVERRVAEQARINFSHISVGKLRRYLSKDNLIDIFRVFRGFKQSVDILRGTSCTTVIGTGGFVSVPVLLAARVLACPVIIHEQTLVPGLANRIGGRLATKVLVTFEESKAYFKNSHIVVTGNPLRTELRRTQPSREDALRRLGFDPSMPFIYVTGGAQGATSLNRVIVNGLPQILQNWQVLHQFGHGRDGEEINRSATKLDLPLQRRYRAVQYVGPEIVDVLTSADLILSRSGAAIVNEIIRLGLPSILVPYPHSVGKEQQKLASILEVSQAAIVIDESSFTTEHLLETLGSLTKGQMEAMRVRSRALAPENVEERLAHAILGTSEGNYFGKA